MNSGMLFFNDFPNYESPNDFNQDGIYELNIQVSKKAHRLADASQVATKSIFIEVLMKRTAAIETLPPGSSTHQHPEHFPVAGIIPFDNPESLSIVGEEVYFSVHGDDAEYFDINQTSRQLYFKASPDFEEVSPVAHNYNISIRVEEVNATQSDSIEMTIEVIDGDDPPNFPLLVVVERCLMLLIPPLPTACEDTKKYFILLILTRKIPLITKIRNSQAGNFTTA